MAFLKWFYPKKVDENTIVQTRIHVYPGTKENFPLAFLKNPVVSVERSGMTCSKLVVLGLQSLDISNMLIAYFCSARWTLKGATSGKWAPNIFQENFEFALLKTLQTSLHVVDFFFTEVSLSNENNSQNKQMEAPCKVGTNANPWVNFEKLVMNVRS